MSPGAVTVASLLAENRGLRVERERLLAHCLRRRGEQLLAAPETPVDAACARRYRELTARLRDGEPLAYLLGRRGFWTLELDSDPRALIPRPETELLVEWALELLPPAPAAALDAGVGGGAVALALGAERPRWSILGVDRSLPALALARRNRRRLGLDNVRFAAMHWCSALRPNAFDLLLANPPYVNAEAAALREAPLKFEPRMALAAAENGFAELRALVDDGRRRLRPGGFMLLEHGADQGAALRAALRRRGWRDVQTRRDLAGLERVTGARA